MLSSQICVHPVVHCIDTPALNYPFNVTYHTTRIPVPPDTRANPKYRVHSKDIAAVQTVSLIISQSPVGSAICPREVKFHIDDRSLMPTTCSSEGFAFCPQGFTCQQQPETSNYYCCSGVDAEGVNGECVGTVYLMIQMAVHRDSLHI